MRKTKVKFGLARGWLFSGLVALGVLLAAPATVWSQEVTAAINGVVTDPSGSAIAGANITAKDLDRGTAWPTTSNGNGFYNLPRLPIGRYEIRAENPGFNAAVQSDILLQLNQNVKIDFQLQVGNVNQTVEVSSAAPVLQTQSSQLGTVIDARTNTQLPLATRNYVQLTLLAPGSVHPNPQNFENGQTTGNGARPYINGNREQSNNFILDGMDNNQVSDNLVGYAPSPDAIQEFNLIEQNASAEFGNFMGGIVSTSIKSGSNGFHGNVFEFFRNDKLNANRWDYNFLGTKRPLLRWNEYGGTFGGPIKRNKLFFFVDYEGERFDTPASTGGMTVLTALERQGNFSELLSQGIKVRNPVTGVAYDNNVIPVGQLSSAALKIINSQYYPAPSNGKLVNNQTNTSHNQTNGDQGDARVDWNASDKDHVFGRYSQSVLSIPTTNSYALSYNAFNEFPTHNGVLDWTRTVGPSLVNDARIGVNYVLINNGAAGNGLGNLNQTFGISGVPSPILSGIVFSNNAFATGPNNSTTAIGNSDVYQLFADAVIQYEDTAILTKGGHTMHLGFQGYRQRIDTFYSGNNGLAGTFTFDGRYSGRAESDFLLGLPSTIGTGTSGGTWGQRANIFGAYFQDDWRIGSNLTVNLGLRYEIHTPWVEVHNRETNFGLISGAVEQPGQNGNSDALYNTYNGIGNWQPRIGLAWTPGGGKTVVRAAYTLSSYLEGTGTNLRLTINPPFSSEHDANYTTQAYPSSTLDQGFSTLIGTNPCTQAGLAAASTACFGGATIRLWDPNVRPAASNQWNFTIQRQFGNSTSLQAGYVGQRTTHLMVAMPYAQKMLLLDGTVVNGPYLSGNPTLKSEIGQISGTASNGNQGYHALQVVLQRRLAQGLSFQANYTWSKCMSDSIGYYGAGGQSAPTSAYWQNLYNKASQWGPCFYDVEHIFSGYATYDLPFGRNRMFGKNMNKVVNAVLGDWQVDAITSFHGGFPLTINAVDKSGTKARSARANCIAPGIVNGYQDAPASLGGGYQWFSPASYAQPTSGFGNCGVGTIRGPGLHTVDLSVSKLFNTTEHQNLELRGEFINLSNTPILNAPNRSIGSNLGVINSSQGARNIQLALKYNF